MTLTTCKVLFVGFLVYFRYISFWWIFENLRKFIISYICFYVPIILVQRGSWVNYLETNDDQCFLVNLSMLITILDVIQAKSVVIPCWRLSNLTSLNLILPKMLCSDPSNPTIHLKSASANILWYCGGRKRNSDHISNF